MTEQKSSAANFISSHPKLRELMSSFSFRMIKAHKKIEIDDETAYVVRGDVLGDEEELLMDSLAKGKASSDPNDPYRALYLELDEESRSALDTRFEMRD